MSVVLCNLGTSLCKAAMCRWGYCSVREQQWTIFHPGLSPRKEGRTHLSLHSDFTVCFSHLVLLQWLQAEKGKVNILLQKPSQPLGDCTPSLCFWGCLAFQASIYSKEDRTMVGLDQSAFKQMLHMIKSAWRISTTSSANTSYNPTLNRGVYLGWCQIPQPKPSKLSKEKL